MTTAADQSRRLGWGDHTELLTAYTKAADVDWTGTREVRTRVVEAIETRSVVVVYGPYGSGKTFAVARACEHTVTHEFPGAEVLCIRPHGSGRDRAIYQTLLSELTGKRPKRSMPVDAIRYELAHVLTERERIIVVDEVQRLSREAQHALQELSDIPGRKSALVLIGDMSTRTKLVGELASRALAKIPFEPLPSDTCAEVLSQLHPLLANTDPDVLRQLNDRKLRGEWRAWCRLVGQAIAYGFDPDEGLELQDIPKIDARL